MKIVCNSFYATKIQYFTEIKLLCDNLEINYNNVRELILKNGWINPMHTNIPGYYGILSFGCDCFPKDIRALNKVFKNIMFKMKYFRLWVKKILKWEMIFNEIILLRKIFIFQSQNSCKNIVYPLTVKIFITNCHISHGNYDKFDDYFNGYYYPLTAYVD